MKGAWWSSPGEIFTPFLLLRINARGDRSEGFFQLRQQRDELFDLLLDIFDCWEVLMSKGSGTDS